MQTQVIHAVTYTTVSKVSGGEVAVQTRPNGRTLFWMNGRRIDRASALRKLGR